MANNNYVIASLDLDISGVSKQAAQLKGDITNLETQLKSLRKENKQGTEEYVNLEAELKKSRKEYNLLNKQLQTNIKTEEDLTKALNKEIDSIDEATKQNKELKQVRNALNKDSKDYQKNLDAINKKIDDNTNFIKGNVSELEQQKIGIGGYREAIDGAIESISKGVAPTKAFTTAIGGVTKATLAFIATPIGPTITALVGIGAAAKAWFDFNNELVESTRLVQQFTGLTGDSLKQARAEATATAETFDKDFKEVVQAANVVSKEFGITFSQAVEQINEGLIKGGKLNEDYLEQIREYSTFFSQAGFSVQEFQNVVNAGFDLGIYNDKLPDALKEASISLNEQTVATRDALVNAFGAGFTDDILARIKSGETSVKEGLEEISQEAEKVGLNSQQAAQLTADLFRGAGEDAGGALKVFEAINVSLSEQANELTELEKLEKQQLEATTELEKTWASLFDQTDGGFQTLIAQGQLFFTNVLLKLIGGAVDFANGLIEIYNANTLVSGSFSIIGEVAGLVFNQTITGAKAVINVLSGIASAIKNILTGDFTGFTDAISNIGSDIENAFKESANNSKQAINGIIDGFKNPKKIEPISLDLTSVDQAVEKQKVYNKEVEKSKVNNTELAKANKKVVESTKELNKAREKQIDLLKEQSEQAILAAKNELREYNLLNESKLDDEKRLTEDLIKEEQNRISKRSELQKEAARVEYEEKLKQDALLLESERLNQEERQALELEYKERLNAIELTEKEEKKALEDAEKEQDKADKAVEFELELLRLEEEDATLAEIDQAKRDQEREIAIQRANEDIQDEELRASTIDKINRDYDEKDLESKKILNQQKTQLVSNAFGQVADILGKETEAGKAAAIAQATIDTYLGATKAYQSLAGIPIIGPVLGGIAAAAAVTAGLKNVQLIKSQKKPDIPKAKAAKGISFVGTLKGASHANGGIDLGNGIEAEGGENMYTDGVNTHIINKKGSDLINKNGIFGALNAINMGTGGVSLGTPMSYLQSGGTATSGITQRNTIDLIEENNQTIRVVNVASDTVDVAQDEIRVENESNF